MNSTAIGRSRSPVPDRRRCKRFRFSAPISISGRDASIIPAMTLEISEMGLSAVLAYDLKIGETVKLYHFAGETWIAQVRHKVGKIYGFEFLDPSDEQVGRLRDICSPQLSL
ncbi:MAG: PilZ domain-containing protein [Candidatus Sulfotelmatobacter sp.]